MKLMPTKGSSAADCTNKPLPAASAGTGSVAVIVTVILLLFVIPQFESLFKGFGADLPAFTQFVVNMSRWMQAKGWLLLILFGGIVYPVESLPGILQDVAWTLPMTHAVEGLRRAGAKPTRAALAAAREGLTDFDLGGGLVVDYGASDHTGLDFADLSIIDAKGRFRR